MFFRWHTTACGGAAYGASLDLEKVYLAAIVNPNTRSTESAWRMFMLTQIRSFSAAAVLAITIAVPAVAATIPFTFTVSGGAALLGPPAPDNPVGVMLFASAEFDPFGPAADYSESGTITFTFWPSGDFAPASVSNNFTASFNAGADTFTGTHTYLFGPPTAAGQTITSTMTILGGTGAFSGATGTATATGTNTPPPGPDDLSPVFFTGSGQITAAALTAVPEPSTLPIMCAALAGAGIWLRRRQSMIHRPN
jgi:hypothetical protein